MACQADFRSPKMRIRTRIRPADGWTWRALTGTVPVRMKSSTAFTSIAMSARQRWLGVPAVESLSAPSASNDQQPRGY
jgi:hypothetical protein